MQQGKHTDYERRLHEEVSARSSSDVNSDHDHRDIDNENKENLNGHTTDTDQDKESKSSRTNSPKDMWPNLSGNNIIHNNSFSERYSNFFFFLRIYLIFNIPRNGSDSRTNNVNNEELNSGHSHDRLSPGDLRDPSPDTNDLKSKGGFAI